MQELELLNGEEFDKIIKEQKENGTPIFDEKGHFTKETLGKWKAIFGFKPTNQD